MLKDNLYYINAYTAGNEGCRFEISLENASVIYKAHFPGYPITPGVCLVQISLELLGIHIGCNYKLSGAKNVKFVTPVVPEIGKSYTFTFSCIRHESNTLSAKVMVTSQDIVYAKMILSVTR